MVKETEADAINKFIGNVTHFGSKKFTSRAKRSSLLSGNDIEQTTNTY
jgi:hypothetical protein